MSDMKDELGHRMKDLESRETERRFLPYIPLYARIDGRSFSRFTKKAKRPFDPSITSAMRAATVALIEQTKPLIAYMQSDEISLVWETTDPNEQMFFNGKVQKLTSVLSGIATAGFIRCLVNDPEWNKNHPNWLDRLPHFDARVCQMPTRSEASNMFVWRESDARKNAITMVASTMFSHKALHGKSGEEKLKMIAEKESETGVAFDRFPASLRRGTFIRRETILATISDEQIAAMPAHVRPEPGTTFARSVIRDINMPPFNQVINRVGVIFDGEEPRVADNEIPE